MVAVKVALAIFALAALASPAAASRHEGRRAMRSRGAAMQAVLNATEGGHAALNASAVAEVPRKVAAATPVAANKSTVAEVQAAVKKPVADAAPGASATQASVKKPVADAAAPNQTSSAELPAKTAVVDAAPNQTSNAELPAKTAVVDASRNASAAAEVPTNKTAAAEELTMAGKLALSAAAADAPGSVQAAHQAPEPPTMADLLMKSSQREPRRSVQPFVSMAALWKPSAPLTLPEHGFHGKEVTHSNMKTATEDWHSEWGNHAPPPAKPAHSGGRCSALAPAALLSALVAAAVAH